ncbi:hypothetical protein ABPG72_002577 [Tetrahymena utriculariae]
MIPHLPISIIQLEKNQKEILDSQQLAQDKALTHVQIVCLNQMTVQTEINSNENLKFNSKQHQDGQKPQTTQLISIKKEQNILKSKRSSQNLDFSDQKKQIDNMNKNTSSILKKVCSSPNLVCQSNNQIYFVNLEMKNIQENKACQSHDENKLEEQIYCRICLDSQSDSETGQLQNVCNCNGSPKYIHQQCLWFQKEKKISNLIEQRFPLQIKCELCKESYRIQFEMTTQTNSASESGLGNQSRHICADYLFFLFLCYDQSSGQYFIYSIHILLQLLQLGFSDQIDISIYLAISVKSYDLIAIDQQQIFKN